MKKKCSECRKQKLLKNFFSDSTRKDGLSYTCKRCKVKKTNAYQKNNPDKTRVFQKRYYEKNIKKCRERTHAYYIKHKKTNVLNQHLFLKYKITLDEYNILLKKQKSVCAICKKECVRRWRLSVDHDHATGVVRGLLCSSCNVALGHFFDDALLLKNAIKYLGKKRPSVQSVSYTGYTWKERRALPTSRYPRKYLLKRGSIKI